MDTRGAAKCVSVVSFDAIVKLTKYNTVGQVVVVVCFEQAAAWQQVRSLPSTVLTRERKQVQIDAAAVGVQRSSEEDR